MTWENLIEETARRSRVDPADAALVMNAMFDTLIRRMETDDLIMLRPDFGYFEMRTTGGEKSPEAQTLRKSRRTPVFKKSGILKKQLRQSDEAYLEALRASGRLQQAERLSKRDGDNSG